MHDVMLASVAAAAAALCAGLMGFAIQRGGTCTVAAVDEALRQRRASRLLAMAEASLWVAGGLALARVCGALPAMPAAYAVSGTTVAGGVLLGLGAWINGACVFGAIARLGSGQWAYAATPAGFYAGCLGIARFVDAAPPRALGQASPLLHAAGPVALAFIAFAAWRIVPPLWAACRRSGVRDRARGLAERAWAPHAATAVIGVTFVAILLLVGVWAYTDVLSQWARGETRRLALGTLCLAALYAGALCGGRAGRAAPRPPTPAAVLRCFAGGATMAAGSLLIPGSNDGLILVGMPLLQPYAWVAVAAMVVSIAAAMSLAEAGPAKPERAAR